LAHDLEFPRKPNDLYLAQGSEVSPDRPLMQGDVLDGVEIAGLEDGEGLGVIVTHACSMRRGAVLAPRLRIARVIRSKMLEQADWTEGFSRHMLLPWLIPGNLEHHFTASLEDAGIVKSESAMQLPRLACLSPFGITLLQQRVILSASRHIVPTSDLHLVNAPVLAELEMLEDWREAARKNGTSYDEAEAIFDELMSADAGDGSLRDDLTEPARRSVVRRQIVDVRRERFGS